MYKIRVILDVQEDVIRTITVNNTINLKELHTIIATSFGFNGQEMASFYRTDDEWNQGEEIPLFSMSEFEDTITMSSCKLQETLVNKHDKLIYVYDFFQMWTFYVEILEIDNEIVEKPTIVMSIGEIPEEAPEKEFVAENTDDEFSDDEFDSFEDYDFDNY